MNGLNTALLIIGIICGVLGIVALLYIISATRRKAITLKKIDYLVEDITYKSEMLNSTVETIAKVANYIDVFETVARKNMKSAAKVIARNKDDIYKIVNRVKKIAVGKEESQPASKTPKRGGK